ncbi:MAG: hypothetical protein ACYC91_13590 [Solirubrobacteraceae bacterium]
MSARIRGEHDTHWGRWRPRTSREGPTASPRELGAAVTDELIPAGIAGRRGRGRSPGDRVLGGLVIVVVAILAAYLAASWAVAQLSSDPAQPRLPATPQAWLDAYEAAALDSPARVCAELFAPQLARAYGNAGHGSCNSYFQRITSFSVTIRRVLRDGGTAVLELRQTVHPRDWAVVLDRRRDGWQAVDVLTGNLAR